MTKTRLAKSLAKYNGGTTDEEIKRLERRKKDIENFGFFFAFLLDGLETFTFNCQQNINQIRRKF